MINMLAPWLTKSSPRVKILTNGMNTLIFFSSLLNHPKSLVRNRVLNILASNAQWDDANRFDMILDDYLAHVTDEKPITARQCIKALEQVGKAKPQYIPRIIACFHSADLSKYKESMRPLIEKDMVKTEHALTAQIPIC